MEQKQYEIGQVVSVTGELKKQSSGDQSSFYPWRYLQPKRALVLGFSARYAGTLVYEEGYVVGFGVSEYRRVIMVMPVTPGSQRYRTPLAVLPEHILGLAPAVAGDYLTGGY